MNLGIVGSRRRDTAEDFRSVWNAYDDVVHKTTEEIVIISGGAYLGADRFAVNIARDQGGKMITYFPYGHTHDDYYERNERIAKDSDILIACVHKDRKGGTEDCIRRFKRLHPNGQLIIVE